MEYLTLKGVAVKQPKEQAVVPKNVPGAGIVTLGVTTSLQQLEVLFPAEVPHHGGEVQVAKGDVVMVATKTIASQPWVREVFSLNGVDFVIVPFEAVFAVGFTPAEMATEHNGVER